MPLVGRCPAPDGKAQPQLTFHCVSIVVCLLWCAAGVFWWLLVVVILVGVVEPCLCVLLLRGFVIVVGLFLSCLLR